MTAGRAWCFLVHRWWVRMIPMGEKDVFGDNRWHHYRMCLRCGQKWGRE